MTLRLQSTFGLNNGVDIPRLGLGVYQSAPGQPTVNAVRYALDLGYRHIDTARAYRNERDVGDAIWQSKVPRQEIFVTTKVWNSDQGFDKTLKACERSLKELRMDFIDLYLIHWPVEGLRLETWRALEKLLTDKKCRSIGVSNYMLHHLQELHQHSATVPVVNQIEQHPFLYLPKLLDYCRAHQIAVEAYAPLTQGIKLGDARLKKIVQRYNKTPAQILIRWSLQHDMVVIPKSVQRERIAENAAVFDFALDDETMREMDGWNENFHCSWDPTAAP